jgi:TetR/AcrR family transcriptional regulator, regulator of biofilm formation and stress response
MAASKEAHDARTTGYGRQALIDAAIAVVARKGLRGLTYRAVAEEAGVTHALVTHHFGSRDAFIQELFDISTREAAAGVFDEAEPLHRFAANLPRLVEEEDELLRFQFELMLEARRRPVLRETIARIGSEIEAAIEAQLERLGCSDEDGSLARFVHAAVDGLLLQQIVYGRGDTESGLEILRELLATRTAG